MIRHAVLLPLSLVACTPAVNVGGDFVDDTEELECQPVRMPAADCPPTPWGERRSFTSVDALVPPLVGKWAFCGGELRYSGRGPVKGLPQGSGVEFWSDAGQLRYAFLRRPAQVLERRTESAASGTVTLRLEGGRARAVLLAGDGVETTWNVDLYDGQQPVLQNAAFDVWNFVAAP